MPNEEKGKTAATASKRRKKSVLGTHRKRKPASYEVKAKRNDEARKKRAAQNKRARKMGSMINWGPDKIDEYTPRSSCSSGSGSDSVSEPESVDTTGCNINEEELTRLYWKPPPGEELRKEIDQLLLDTNGTWVRVPGQKRKRERNGGGTKKRRMTKKHKKSTRITRKRHNKKR
jgi:hypothetical protein